VAGFLGVSNLLPGKRADGASDGYAAITLRDQTTVRVPATLLDGQQEIEVGVRPEKIRLHELKDEVPAAFNRLQGTIVDASYIGVSTQYIVEAQGGARITVYEQNVERATRAELWAPGEEVQLTWSPDHSFVVHDTSGSSGEGEPE
jgi:spermidine/putrescine transport system ATP-binding protein